MDNFTLPYGSSSQFLHALDADLILPNPAIPAEDPYRVIHLALEAPIQCDVSRLSKCSSVAIAINDKTRPVPHKVILPPLLDWLKEHGVQNEAVHFYIATGSHLPMPADEFSRILPEEMVGKYSVETHDINFEPNLTRLGTTSRGTPVIVNSRFYQSDFKIVVGDIEPHHFAGFSGGYKTAAIGLAGRETINANHAWLVDPQSWIGVYETNPLRQDIEEIGSQIGVDLALNTILTTEKDVVAAVAGSPGPVMAAGIPISRKVCSTPITDKYDVVVASAGGHPKDINFYQAQKALTHASLFCKPGGMLILIAACPEGSGSKAYESFMVGVHSIHEVFEKFKSMQFQVGPHKAFQVARLLERFQITLVSEMPNQQVSKLLMETADSAQQALDRALATWHTSCRIAVLPHATTTLPILA